MNLTLKKIPAPLHRSLKARAKRNRRSLNAEAICLLERASLEPVPDVNGIIAELEKINRRQKGPLLTSAEIRAAIQEGRE
jgi:antitoxin FitA